MSASKNTKKTPSKQPGPTDRDKSVDTESVEDSALKASDLSSNESALLLDQADTGAAETVEPEASENTKNNNNIKAQSSKPNQPVPQPAQRSKFFGFLW